MKPYQPYQPPDLFLCLHLNETLSAYQPSDLSLTLFNHIYHILSTSFNSTSHDRDSTDSSSFWWNAGIIVRNNLSTFWSVWLITAVSCNLSWYLTVELVKFSILESKFLLLILKHAYHLMRFESESQLMRFEHVFTDEILWETSSRW